MRRIRALVRSLPIRSGMVALASAAAVTVAAGGAAAGGAGPALQWGDTYAGVSVGLGRSHGRLTDLDGFSTWSENRHDPGRANDYGGNGAVGGLLVGKKATLADIPVRIELDASFANIRASTDEVDPDVRDETVRSRFRWLATARAGIERTFGRATFLASAGVAAARTETSLTDLDRRVVDGIVTPWYPDPDDSFSARSTRIGWVVGLGVETSPAQDWTLRLEGLHAGFGRSTRHVNRSGAGRCWQGGPRRPCAYDVDNDLTMVRLAFIRSFGP